MYIYKAMDTGVLEDANQNVDENMRVIEVEGQLTHVVGIRYKPVDSGAAAVPAGLALTDDGKLVDTSSHSDDVDDSEYWADRPSGFLGGKRLTSTLREDIAVRPPCRSAESRFTRIVACISNFSMGPGTLSCLLQENKQEGKQIWNMFKQDPLSPAKAYWHCYGMPGIGLFLEGYVVSGISQFIVRTLLCVAVPKVVSSGAYNSQSLQAGRNV